MNRREWIGVTVGMLVTVPSGVSLAEIPPASEEAKLLGSHPIWIGCGSDNYRLDWIKCLQQTNVFGDFWHWQWREKTNDADWFVGECTTSEPRINILGGKLCVSLADDFKLIWNG